MEAAAFLSVLKAGTYVALSYVDDPDVWHDALITWPSLGRRLCWFNPYSR